jgi:hypothetical protein
MLDPQDFPHAFLERSLRTRRPSVLPCSLVSLSSSVVLASAEEDGRALPDSARSASLTPVCRTPLFYRQLHPV